VENPQKNPLNGGSVSSGSVVFRTEDVCSLPEMTVSGHHHRQSDAVSSCDHFDVLLAPPRLGNRRDSSSGSDFDPIGEGKKGI
jgi:hypothetical protein